MMGNEAKLTHNHNTGTVQKQIKHTTMGTVQKQKVEMWKSTNG